MGDNYKPWGVDYKEFYTQAGKQDRLRFLLRFAILAPSSHNSQPWSFRVDGDEIIIFPEDARMLPKSDTVHRQLYISIGAALENILAAAEFYGYRSEVRYLPQDSRGAAVAIKLEATGDVSLQGERTIMSIISRHSNRNKYSGEKLPERFLDWVKSKSQAGFRIYVVTERKLKDKIAGVVSDALVEAMDDRNFRSELGGYIKPNTTKHKTGMPMFGFGMPTVLSFIAPYLLSRFNVNRLSRAEDEALLKDHTPHFVIITSTNDDKESWIKSGQIFESVALGAEREKIRTAPMAAAIEIGDNHKRIQKILGTNMRPQVFFRMGYADAITPHSPRLGVEDVLEKE